MFITVIGIDLGKNCFHLYIVYDGDLKAKRKKLTRHEYIVQLSPCTIAMEACSGAHYLAQEFISEEQNVKCKSLPI